MNRRQGVMADIVSAQQLNALIVVEAMRAGTATGWITPHPRNSSSRRPGHPPGRFFGLPRADCSVWARRLLPNLSSTRAESDGRPHGGAKLVG